MHGYGFKMPAAAPVRRGTASAVKRGPRLAKGPFDPERAVSQALETLAAPPALPRIERVDPLGELVARWALPLELCPGVNVLREIRQAWRLKKIKDAALELMLRQVGGRRAPAPLLGRPMVRCVRFSSREGDHDASFSKIPLDRLQVGRRKRPAGVTPARWAEVERQMGPVGLGYLRDDAPAALQLATWWEPAPPGAGCVLVELYRGTEEAR